MMNYNEFSGSAFGMPQDQNNKKSNIGGFTGWQREAVDAYYEGLEWGRKYISPINNDWEHKEAVLRDDYDDARKEYLRLKALEEKGELSAKELDTVYKDWLNKQQKQLKAQRLAKEKAETGNTPPPPAL